MSSGCTTCTGACCRQYLVHVSGRDAVTIARGQGLTLEQFVAVVPASASGGAAFTLDDSGAAFNLALRRRPDGACTFLIDLTDGSSRCGIYPQRPLTCAVFPLHLHRGSVDIRSDVICEPQGRRITVVDLPRARALLFRTAFEWSTYETVVATWNESRAAASTALDAGFYLAYVGAVYDAIDAVLAGRPADATANAMAHWTDGVRSDEVATERAELERAIATAIAPVARSAFG